jgi:hypothetical protein
MEQNQTTTVTTLDSVTKITDAATAAQFLFDDYLTQYNDFNEFAQGRTNFQIEKFIATADNTPVNCFVNTLHQVRVMRGELLREVKEATELMRTFKLKYPDGDLTPPDTMIKWPNNEGQMQNCWYDLDKIAHDHRVLELSINIKDKIQQLEYFNKILARMKELHGGDFTREEYEAEAPAYWNARLTKQIASALMSSRYGIDTGNYEALLNATAAPILPDSLNKPIQFPMGALHALTTGSLFDGTPANLGDVINYLQASTQASIANVTGTVPQLQQNNNPTFESLGVVGNDNSDPANASAVQP